VVSSPDPREPALRWSLALWCLTAALLLWLAPPPPPPPVTSAEDEAIFQRTVDQTVERTRRWQHERGDQTIEWDQARGHLAIVIDDVGSELHLFEQLHALRFPLTFSVLPGAVYAPGAQLRLRADRRRPREILLHLPCEPEDLAKMGDAAEPGERFLRAEDSPAQLQEALTAALQRVPGAVGVSNHPGSRLTASRAAMDALMPALRARGLYFLDSPHSQALSAAEEAEVPALGRDLVLDADPSPAAVLAQLERAAERAEQRPVVVIAHPSPAVVETLREGLPRLHARGIGVYPLRELLAHQAPQHGE
jgi:polysaccharide deacetylase 2 family uncharacterized protein YibQ